MQLKAAKENSYFSCSVLWLKCKFLNIPGTLSAGSRGHSIQHQLKDKVAENNKIPAIVTTRNLS